MKIIFQKNRLFIKQLSSSYALFATNTLLMIFQTPMLLHYFSEDLYGVWILYQNVFNYFGLFSFGFMSVLLIKYTQKTEKTIIKYLNTVFFSLLFFSFLAFLFFLVLFYVRNYFLKVPHSLGKMPDYIFISLFISFVFNFISSYFELLIFHIYKSVITKNILDILRLISMTGLYFGVVYLDLGFKYICYVNILVTFVFLAIYMAYTLQHFKLHLKFEYFDKKLILELFKEGYPFLLLMLTNMFIFNGDNLLIANILGSTFIVTYSLTFRLSDVCIKFIRKIVDTKTPELIELIKSKNDNKLKSIFNKIQITSFFFSIIACILNILLGKLLLEIWLKKQLVIDNNLVLVFSVNIIVNTMFYTNWVLLNILGYQKKLALISILEIGINITLSIILGQTFGLIGIGLATLIATSVCSLGYSFYLKKMYFNRSLTIL